MFTRLGEKLVMALTNKATNVPPHFQHYNQLIGRDGNPKSTDPKRAGLASLSKNNLITPLFEVCTKVYLSLFSALTHTITRKHLMECGV